MPSLGLVLTTSSTFDIDLAVFIRRVEGAINNYQANDTAQTTLDINLVNRFSGYTAAQRNELVIVDVRMFNGSWDNRSLINKKPDYLADCGRGSFRNKLGFALAVAKIIHNNSAARKKMFQEAVAHDVFMGGYAEAQRGALFAKLNRLTTNWDHWSGSKTEVDTNNAFWESGVFFNTRMKAYYGLNLGNKTLRITPQFWRIFEVDVRMIPADVILPVGVYRTAPPFMNPQNGIFPKLGFAESIPPP